MIARTLALWQRLVHGQKSLGTISSGTVAVLDADIDDSEAERRVWVRHPSNLETVLHPTADGPETRLPAKIQNVSLGGISLLVDRDFEPGELISIEMPRGDGQPSTQILAYVVHASPQPSGGYSLGCTFARELSDVDLQVLGARRLKAEPSDQRNWERFPTELKACYHFLADDDQESHSAAVLNISASGIGLAVAQEIETGTLLNVEMHGPNGRPPLTMLACVVHVTARANDWTIGCNFIRELSAKDLKALL